MKRLPLKNIWVLAAALLLGACGGGGGSSQPSVREALPQIVQDINPAGARLDFRSRNYFPGGAGDTWTFDRVQGGVTTPGVLTRSVQSVNGNDVVVAETEAGSTDTATYRRTANGIVNVDPLAGAAPPAARTLVGDLLEFPEPFYAVGETRQVIRQGSWGADLDGDNVAESFRLEFAHVLVGFETLVLPRGSAETAHFRSTTTLTLSPSSLAQRVVTVTATEDSWWAPGIGMVRAQRVATDSDGVTVIPAYTLIIASGSVGGAALFAVPPDGTVQKIALVHNALVYDALRNRYYASIPGSVVGNGNSIAAIDPTTGAVSYSAAVGSEPFALGLAADGSALYVGLNGSGEVIRLRLPDLLELSRTRLPVPAFFGQLLAETIAVSPVDPDVVAVSTWRSQVVAPARRRGSHPQRRAAAAHDAGPHRQQPDRVRRERPVRLRPQQRDHGIRPAPHRGARRRVGRAGGGEHRWRFRRARARLFGVWAGARSRRSTAPLIWRCSAALPPPVSVAGRTRYRTGWCA